jgi:hypothetical protein
MTIAHSHALISFCDIMRRVFFYISTLSHCGCISSLSGIYQRILREFQPYIPSEEPNEKALNDREYFEMMRGTWDRTMLTGKALLEDIHKLYESL